MDKEFEQFFQQQGFKTATEIQMAVYEPLKQDRSVIGLAPTGSGKTLAFTIPLLEKTVPGDGTQILVLSPSQELAVQTTDVFRQWGAVNKIKATSLTGGANMQRQIERLKKHPEVVVGTPGRMLSLIHESRLKLKDIQTIIVDEADELLTGDTLDEVREIVMASPTDVQLGFFSATQTHTPKELETIFGVDIEEFDVRQTDKTQGEVIHGLVRVADNKKVVYLRRLAKLKHFQGLVFFNHVSTLEHVAAELKHEHVSSVKLAGHQVQTERATAMQKFRKGEAKLMLTTEMAARGLDIANLPAVINFDLPQDAIAYTHRTGRTGRMGNTGMIVNMGNDHDLRNLRKLLPETTFKPLYLMHGKLTDELEEVEPERPAEATNEAKSDEAKSEVDPNATVVMMPAVTPKKVTKKYPAKPKNTKPAYIGGKPKKHAKHNKHSKKKGMRHKNIERNDRKK
ncbi:DEAD/DEAH box helicase [Pediococcus damnosus]|uniref:DEAD/DEAH box helicase n=1 Tax=Pediococcus damnosus TaxID=51663 RepID=UPI003F6BE32E